MISVTPTYDSLVRAADARAERVARLQSLRTRLHDRLSARTGAFLHVDVDRSDASGSASIIATRMPEGTYLVTIRVLCTERSSISSESFVELARALDWIEDVLQRERIV